MAKPSFFGLLLIALSLVFLALTLFVLRKTEAMQKSVERYYSDLAERASDTLGPPDGTEPEALFIDVSTTGTSVSIGSHDVSTAVPIGFDFDFYGETYSQVFVSSNGFLTFLAGEGEGCCGGAPLPDPAQPNGLITGLWAHLHPNFGTIFRQTLGVAPNRQFVLMFKAVSNFNGGPDHTWEIILHESTHEIVVQYASAHGSGTTGGIENALGTLGLNWAGPAPVALVAQAVRYVPTADLSIDDDGDARIDLDDTD